VESGVGAMKIVLLMPLRAALTIACICLVLMLGMTTAGQAANSGTNIGDIKNFHSNFIHHQDKSPVGQLVLPKDTIYFPWYGQDEVGAKSPACKAVSSCHPVKEDIHMKGSHASSQVQDLRAMNSAKQRDIVYDEVQRGDAESQGLTNSMDIQVSGGAKGDQDKEEYVFFGNDIESLVDSALASNMDGAYSGKSVSAKGSRFGNNMNIEVSGISVSAINTVEGGSAVANSNIVIKPVQIINVPAEVDEKLK
jgi:hypothetical protein